VLGSVFGWPEEELHRVCKFGGKNIEPWASFLRHGDVEEITSDMGWLKEVLKS
jgi:hypothetical protein